MAWLTSPVHIVCKLEKCEDAAHRAHCEFKLFLCESQTVTTCQAVRSSRYASLMSWLANLSTAKCRRLMCSVAANQLQRGPLGPGRAPEMGVEAAQGLRGGEVEARSSTGSPVVSRPVVREADALLPPGSQTAVSESQICSAPYSNHKSRPGNEDSLAYSV